MNANDVDLDKSAVLNVKVSDISQQRVGPNRETMQVQRPRKP